MIEFIILLVLLLIVIVLLIINLLHKNDSNQISEYLDKKIDILVEIQKNNQQNLLDVIKDIKKDIAINNDKIEIKLNLINDSIKDNLHKISVENLNNYSTINNTLNGFINNLLKDFNETNEKISIKLKNELDSINTQLKAVITDLKEDLNVNLRNIREENNLHLNRINDSVNEKLEKTLDGRLKQSFDNVVEQIGGVNKAIGEIKGIASEVGSLKTILTNGKTKGIVGEVILGNIIENMLTTEQYVENFASYKNSQDRVEYAIKMPGNGDDFVYLPIDSKFPLVSYQKIQQGQDEGIVELIKEGRRELEKAIKEYAKDISTKYINVPLTTEFAVMFLPVEGLYVETLNLGLFEELQSKYKVTIVGPTTLTALLNALQMGFKTLTIQKKSSEVFKLLGAVKTEFKKFAETLEKTQKKVNDASSELDKLVGTRTRQIESKLRNIEVIDSVEASKLLDD